MSEYTKGEWKAVKHNCSTGYFTVQAADKHDSLLPIANMTCHHAEEKEANAHLISAAPDMYEALSNITSVLVGYGSCLSGYARESAHKGNRDNQAHWEAKAKGNAKMLTKINAILTKAEGKS